MDVAAVVGAVAAVLGGYVFRVRSEAELQEMVRRVLETEAGTKVPSVTDVGGARALPGIKISTEVRVEGSRFDIMLDARGVKVVIELKLRASAAAVERQAQRYALLPDVAAVIVVTTSKRLASQLSRGGPEIGSKPFRVVAVRTS